MINNLGTLYAHCELDEVLCSLSLFPTVNSPNVIHPSCGYGTSFRDGGRPYIIVGLDSALETTVGQWWCSGSTLSSHL